MTVSKPELSDQACQEAADELEALCPSHVLAGVPKPVGWMKTWPELQSYSHYDQLRSLISRGFAAILRAACTGEAYEAASRCGRPLVFKRLLKPDEEVRTRLLALVEGEKLGPKVELTPERLDVIRAVLREVLTAEDWEAMAGAAAEQVQQQVMGLRAA